jgi:MFS family permease
MTRNRVPLIALYIANAISQIGNLMAGVAIPWFVLQTTGSPVQTGISVVASTLPLFIMGFLSGSLVDRYSPKRVSILSDILSGVSVAAIPALFALGGLSYPALLALIFIGTILDLPGTTARQSLLPDLITRANVRPERANAAYQGIFRFSILIGPPLGGLLITLFDTATVLWIDAATFAVSAVLISVFAPRVEPAPPQPKTSYKENVLAGLRLIRRNDVLLALLVLFGLVDLFANSLLLVALPVYARRVYGSAVDFGAALGALGGGMLAGTILFGAVGYRLSRRWTIIAGLFVSSIPVLGLLLMPTLPVTLAIFALMGLGLGPCATLAMTVFQERTPAELRGRVFGARIAISNGAIPLGALVTGALLEGAGLVPTVALLALCYLSIPFLALVIPAMREIDAQTPGGLVDTIPAANSTQI